MRFLRSKLLSVLPFLYLTVVAVSSLETPTNRNAKHFSLFSVVQFDNEECTTDTTPAGGTTEGTCYTSTECTDKGGVNAGRCAAGFGVCCAFINIAAAANNAAATIMENRTRLRNAEFPDTAAAVAAQTIPYTISKMQSDICQLRLDFTRFVIAGPANTQENIGTANPQTTNTNCVDDTLTITTSDAANVNDSPFGTLCGILTGEHLYVELTPDAAANAVVTIGTAATAVVAPATALRAWDIKVSQIECFATYRAPSGCNRFISADAGQITSFNFGLLANGGRNLGIELPSQRVKTCIRRSKGMCCVEYQVCAAFGGIALADVGQVGAASNMGVGFNTNAATMQWINAGWSIDTNTDPYMIDTAANVIVNTADFMVQPQINIGMVDAQCSGDYVEIPSSWSGGCGSAHGSARNTINSRYCGARFGANFQQANGQGTSHTPVCDCSEPFVVRHNSDSVNDIGGTAAAAINANKLGNAVPRGFCLDFRQLPCWN